VIGRQFCTTFDTNIQHWIELVKTMQKSTSDRLTDRWLNEFLNQYIPMHIFVLEESVHDAQCVVTALAPRYHLLSKTMLPNHALPYSRIVPNVCVEVSQKCREFVSFNLSYGISSTNSGYNAPEFGSYACMPCPPTFFLLGFAFGEVSRIKVMFATFCVKSFSR